MLKSFCLLSGWCNKSVTSHRQPKTSKNRQIRSTCSVCVTPTPEQAENIEFNQLLKFKEKLVVTGGVTRSKQWCTEDPPKWELIGS